MFSEAVVSNADDWWKNGELNLEVSKWYDIFLLSLKVHPSKIKWWKPWRKCGGNVSVCFNPQLFTITVKQETK